MKQTLFRFEHTLAALEMGAPALRRWLALGLIGGMAKTGGGPLEFTPFDISVLALTKAMVDFNLPVATAHAFAVRLMRQQGPWSGDEPVSSYWTVFAPKFQIQVSRVVGKGGKAGWGVATFEETDAFTSAAHLTLFPRELVKAALERAIEAAEVREAKRSA
jgi:hypothetical protein